MTFLNCLNRLISCRNSNPWRFSSTRAPHIAVSLTSEFPVNHRHSSTLNGLSRILSPSYWLPMYNFRQMQDYSAGGTAPVTVLNHNVLAQDLIELHPHLYRHHNPQDLVWEKRQELLFDEFLSSNADIIALQEVQQDHIEPFYKRLEDHGYSGAFKKRTSSDKTDGCALYYKREVFHLIELEEVEYYQPGIQVLNRPNVAIIAKLRHKLNNKVLVIANTHLLYNPKRWNIRLAQIQILLAEIKRIVGASKSPAILLVGDLNSDPRSPIIRLLEKGYYEAEEPVLPDYLGILPNCTHKSKSKLYNSKLVISLFNDDEEGKESCDKNEIPSDAKADTSKQGESSCKKNHESVQRDSFLKTPESHLLSHNFNFTSTYNFYDENYRSEATTYQDRWINVDYMFYSNMILISRQRLPTVDECVNHIGYIPNTFAPSDHLPLLATYGL
uniref:Protein angel 2 n=1 Tax=Lygus hesperus TaxID=30085 RepID=A0A0A9XND7_LYGHE